MQGIKTMSEVKNIFFKDFITLQRGFDLPKKDMVEGDYPVFGSTSIIGYHNEYKEKPPGVITGRSGSLGTVQYINDEYWPHNTALWVKDFKGNHPRYVYYFLQTLNLGRFNSGAGVPTLNRNDLDTLEIEVHSLSTQRKIASILSAYDDLIENNKKRIKILEEMAQAIYKEWFVNFRFPGHKKVKMVKSKLDMIPEGWEVSTVQDTFEITGGGTPSKKVPEYWEDGTINWYVPSDLTAHRNMFMDESGEKISELGLKKSSARLFPAYSVMMTSRATLGVISINTTEACTNQGFITCIPNEKFPLYTLYYWLHENVEKFISLGTGATFKEITKGVFKKIDILVPPEKLLKYFEKILAPLNQQVLILQRKNTNLRKTRDLLLPKLISGEIDVKSVNVAQSA